MDGKSLNNGAQIHHFLSINCIESITNGNDLIGNLLASTSLFERHSIQRNHKKNSLTFL